MSVKPPSRAAKARSLLCERTGQAIQGVKIEWSSVYPPAGNPFDYSDADNIPDQAIKAGVNVSGKLSTNTKGKIK